ncbi:MAG TPA: hypothetical protein VD913_06090 [bacterium]|nr:hypothetical protein [bacterium]
MKRIGMFFILALFGIIQTASAQPAAKDAQYLFVQSANAGSFDGQQLTLEGVGQTIFFSDRPYRINGHVRTKTFAETWTKGADSFAANPPNATLSIFDEKGVQNAVIELLNPVAEGKTITYDVKVLEGKIPATFGEASLFIDDTGWGVTGGLLGGMLLGKVMGSGSQGSSSQYNQAPNYSYRQAPPAPC